MISRLFTPLSPRESGNKEKLLAKITRFYRLLKQPHSLRQADRMTKKDWHKPIFLIQLFQDTRPLVSPSSQLFVKVIQTTFTGQCQAVDEQLH